MTQPADTQITDQQVALDPSRGSDSLFRAAFEENPETIGIFRPILDGDGRFVDVELLYQNRTGRQRYYGGAPLEALVGSRQFERWPDSRPFLEDLFRRYVEHGAPHQGRLHGIRADGEYWADVSLFSYGERFVLIGRDVTAAVLAERQAAQLDIQYRTVLDTMLDAVVMVRPVRDGDGDGPGAIIDLECVYINAAGISAPLTPEQVIGSRLLAWWPDARTNGLFDQLVEVVTTGRPLALDAVALGDPVSPQLEPQIVDLRVHRVAPDLVAATWRDVTEIHRGAQALAASEERYAQLVDGIPVGVYRARTSADGHARWDYVSDRCARILGVAAHVLVADPVVLFQAIHPEDRAALLHGNARAHRELRPVTWELRILRDGEWRLIRFANQPAERDGEERLWHGSVEDITEQRRTAEALRTSEERYRVIAEHANDVTWTMSPDGHITSVSPSIERVRGISPAVAMAQTLEQIHPPGSAAVSQAYYAQLLEDIAAGRHPAPFHGELEYLHADGGTVWCDVRVVPQLDAEGRLVELIGVSRDITERRQHEEQLRRFNEELERRVAERTRELEAANEELRSFSYSVSHDLRAPVRAVAGFARILQRDLGEQLDADALHKLDNIRVAGETMGRLIDDLLSYTRIGQGAVHAEPVALGPVVEGVRIALGARIAEAGGSLELVEPAATPLGDRSLLDRVLLNLVENAVAYRRPDVPPHIRVTARPAADALDRITIEVADNGIGIPRDAWDRIFEVFTRLDPGNDPSRSGIGLATVRKAVRAMGSDVTLDSVVGEGTTFRFTLPAAPAD